mgnify:CR=1 FL=1
MYRMDGSPLDPRAAAQPGLARRVGGFLHAVFLSSGILPLVLLLSIIGFGLAEPRFLHYENLFNVARHATYLIIVSMGQMLTLLVRGIDMSVGSTVAFVSVVTALVMSSVAGGDPAMAGVAIAAGMVAGLAAGACVGAINGVGITIFKVNPFIMTVGMLSVLTGAALKLSDGMPVYGMPTEFARTFAYWAPLDIPAPALFAAALFGLMVYVLYGTPLGRRIYAIGGNSLSSRLAGINVTAYTILTYVLCSTIVAFGSILLTARVNTGEATLGATLLVESITAVVIGGVSFFGGIGRVGNVVLGAVFVTLMTNGMNMLRVDSYVQQIVLGCLLILAVIVDQFRIKLMRQERYD